MSEASPNPSRPGSSPHPSRPGSSSTESHGPSASRASVPPSEPRPSRASFGTLDLQVERPARAQLIVALLLALVLVAIPLYLWRRPRSEAIAVADRAAGASSGAQGSTSPPEEPFVVGEPKTLSCHDPGPKKTPPDQCDRLSEVEKALAAAVQENAACVPRDAGGGTVTYLAEISFKKKGIALSTPKEPRTFKNDRVVATCRAAIKAKLERFGLDGVKHEHARYRLQVVATYPGAVKP